MFNRNDKDFKNIEVSAGLLVGYILAASANMFFFDKKWQDAFSDEKLIFGFAAISLSIVLYIWRKRKTEKS